MNQDLNSMIEADYRLGGSDGAWTDNRLGPFLAGMAEPSTPAAQPITGLPEISWEKRSVESTAPDAKTGASRPTRR